MESNPIEKKLKNESVDWISSMHDSILCKILSYVPTKDVVATSILSTRWKNLSPFELPPIKIDLNDYSRLHSSKPNKSESVSRNFMNFVDKLLNETLRDVPYVEKIVIQCREIYDDDKIVLWVFAALRFNVEHLRLMYKLKDSMALFNSLNSCKTLVELELGRGFELCLPKDFILPNLKRLSLYALLFLYYEKSIYNLLDGCPMLDELSLNDCSLLDFSDLYIKSTLLKKLVMKQVVNVTGYRVDIDTPNLEVFECDGCSVDDYAFADYKSLHSVRIEFWSVYDENLTKVLKSCSSPIPLYSSGNMIMALHRASHRLPTFQNLNCLVLGHMGSHGFEILAYFLKSAPSLQTLTIEKGFKNCQEGYSKFQSLLPRVLVCLKLCLKKVEFREFKGEEDKIKLIEYFLKNGEVLHEIKIHYLRYVDASILNRLHMFQRHSQKCQILLKQLSSASYTSAMQF